MMLMLMMMRLLGMKKLSQPGASPAPGGSQMDQGREKEGKEPELPLRGHKFPPQVS